MKSMQYRRRFAPALSLLTLALLGAMSMPVFAADPPCVDTNGNPTGASTDQGNENGQDNATCTPDANAYGQGNNASGSRSNASGMNNSALIADSNAFGFRNNALGG